MNVFEMPGIFKMLYFWIIWGKGSHQEMLKGNFWLYTKNSLLVVPGNQ